MPLKWGRKLYSLVSLYKYFPTVKEGQIREVIEGRASEGNDCGGAAGSLHRLHSRGFGVVDSNI